MQVRGRGVRGRARCWLPLGSLQHHIKARSPCEDVGAANRSLHLCKPWLPPRVLPVPDPAPQAFPGSGPLPRFGEQQGGTVAGEKSCVAGMLLVFKGVCSVPEVLLLQRLRATSLVLSL